MSIPTIPTAQQSLLNEVEKAQKLVTVSKDEQFAGIESYDFKSNPPLSMAKLISQTLKRPDGSYLSVADSFVLALHWYETGLNPYMGDIYMLPSGRIGTSLQGKLKLAKVNGYDLGAPTFTEVDREWPSRNGQPILLVRKERGSEFKFKLDREPGVKCTMAVNKETVEYTAWLTEWFMPSNPNWFERAAHMLRVRAHDKAISQGTGIGVSEDISVATDPLQPATVDSPVSEPKKVPFTR